MTEPEYAHCVVNCAAYTATGERRDIDIEQISEVLAVDDGSFVWVGLYEPGPSVLAKLQEEFALHPLAVEDAQNAHQRPKFETYGDSIFIAVHTAQSTEGAIRFGETHMFVGPRYFVTVRHGASSSYAPARARLEREKALLMHGPGAALYAVLDLIVDNFMPIVDEYDRLLGELEKDVFAADFRKETVERLYWLKRDLTRLRMAAEPLQDIISHLTRMPNGLIDDVIQPYLRDVLDHAIRIQSSTETLREMLTAAVGVNLSLVTVQQGEVVKRLGAWAGLLVVPTLIASWYGMNFEHMPELHGRWSYFIVIGATALVTLSLYWKFKKARWL
ncbi:magnesium and cobalt transport protein CorA [Lysobacter sp. TY2-98]|uniref:magnesium and cobalt transport protein CorA n=1 Tax=Lysobacter sp. TY2-98 TaxID=2290922 RepID=UPI000E208584|nr:magnesium and cobalt transport protein CorA [Lysobacter sp. TY2-98]AXK71454.1 magnesium and cobalt transport protein CorA [Lysobacter sp. TY2-98]